MSAPCTLLTTFACVLSLRLTHHAFLSVFVTKPTLFRSLIAELRQTVEVAPAGRAMGEEWEGLVEEAWVGMRGVVY